MTRRAGIIDSSSPYWEAARALVSATYRSEFQAEWNGQPDHFLVTLQGDVVCAAVGLTHGLNKRLLADQYLGADSCSHPKVRQIIPELERANCLEAGPAASRDPGEGVNLITQVPAVAWLMGADAIFVTATNRIHALLLKVGWEYYPLVEASPEALDESKAEMWGTYYDNSPVCGVAPAVDCINSFRKWREQYNLKNTLPNTFFTLASRSPNRG